MELAGEVSAILRLLNHAASHKLEGRRLLRVEETDDGWELWCSACPARLSLKRPLKAEPLVSAILHLFTTGRAKRRAECSGK